MHDLSDTACSGIVTDQNAIFAGGRIRGVGLGERFFAQTGPYRRHWNCIFHHAGGDSRSHVRDCVTGVSIFV